MSQDLEIRMATEKDVPIILNLIKQFAEHGNVSHELKATEEILTESLFGHKSYAEVIIGYLNQRPVSYALFTHNFSTLLGVPGILLVDIFVIPGNRNQGIGRNMFVYLAKLAKERKCGRLEWLALQSNESAIIFYEKMGAKPMDHWKTFRITKETINKLVMEAG